MNYKNKFLLLILSFNLLFFFSSCSLLEINSSSTSKSNKLNGELNINLEISQNLNYGDKLLLNSKIQITNSKKDNIEFLENNFIIYTIQEPSKTIDKNSYNSFITKIFPEQKLKVRSEEPISIESDLILNEKYFNNKKKYSELKLDFIMEYSYDNSHKILQNLKIENNSGTLSFKNFKQDLNSEINLNEIKISDHDNKKEIILIFKDKNKHNSYDKIKIENLEQIKLADIILKCEKKIKIDNRLETTEIIELNKYTTEFILKCPFPERMLQEEIENKVFQLIGEIKYHYKNSKKYSITNLNLNIKENY
jgi:hypothetical protein